MKESLRGCCSVSDLDLKGLQVRMTWSWDGKTGCQVQKTKDKLESTRTNSDLQLSPHFQLQWSGQHAGRSWQPSMPNYTCTWWRPQSREEERSRSWGIGGPVADSDNMGNKQICTHRWSCSWAPCCVLVGVMALASPPPSKSHRNVFCSQLYLTQIINR